MQTQPMELFERLESNARSYCRDFRRIFEQARGWVLVDTQGRQYIDFLCSAGAANYGHNNPQLKHALIEYLAQDGPTTSLDLHTQAKYEFIHAFEQAILAPRGLQYRLQFTGPTGTSAVESAVKLARKCTGRTSVVAFTNAFHGMSATSLSLTGNRHYRQHCMAGHVDRMPFDGYLGRKVDTLDYFHKLLSDRGSGLDIPAAVIVETVQVEGGLNIASREWLRRLSHITSSWRIPLIVDDIQAGCGRTGTFFSFEAAGIVPDMVCLSKSIGGLGLPMALLLIAPEHDVWKPGEDSGTFRGNNLAFVCGTAALRQYWSDVRLQQHIAQLETIARNSLDALVGEFPHIACAARGRGMIHGVELHSPAYASAVQAHCFENGLIIERCGSEGQVLKIMPPLVIPETALAEGLRILGSAIEHVSRTMHETQASA